MQLFTHTQTHTLSLWGYRHILEISEVLQSSMSAKDETRLFLASIQFDIACNIQQSFIHMLYILQCVLPIDDLASDLGEKVPSVIESWPCQRKLQPTERSQNRIFEITHVDAAILNTHLSTFTFPSWGSPLEVIKASWAGVVKGFLILGV